MPCPVPALTLLFFKPTKDIRKQQKRVTSGTGLPNIRLNCTRDTKSESSQNGTGRVDLTSTEISAFTVESYDNSADKLAVTTNNTLDPRIGRISIITL